MVADKAAKPEINKAKVSRAKAAINKARAAAIRKAKVVRSRAKVVASRRARVDHSRAEKAVHNRAARVDPSREGKADRRAAKVDQAGLKEVEEGRAGLVRAEAALVDHKVEVEAVAVDRADHNKAEEEAAAPE